MTVIENNHEYTGSRFEKADLSDQTIRGVVFEDCTFIRCDFSSAVAQQCRFTDCVFEQCNMSLLAVPETRFSGTEFTGTKMIGIDWTKAYWPKFDFYSQLVFKECILDSNNFFDLRLHESHFESCRIHNADFRQAELNKSVMHDCDLTDTLFMHTNLEGADLSGSHSFYIDIRENKTTKATFSAYEALNLLRVLDIRLAD
ncbi:TPA: pentapeptide repeat-containing protein [Morganella morganii]|nr:pentapeptide repeat-containing protein [Morganella morganii]